MSNDMRKLMNFPVGIKTTVTATADEDIPNLGQVNTALAAKADLSGGKIPVSQLPTSVMELKGSFNATTGSPVLADGTGDTGDTYYVSVAGSHDFGAGAVTLGVGDFVIYDGANWQHDPKGTIIGAGAVGNTELANGAVSLLKLDAGLQAMLGTLGGASFAATDLAQGVAVNFQHDQSTQYLSSVMVYDTVTTEDITHTVTIKMVDANNFTVQNDDATTVNAKVVCSK